MDDNIKQFISRLTYWQKMNLLITIFQADNHVNRDEAYEKSLDVVTDDEQVFYQLDKMLGIGPII
ncbi:hypothetical protein J6K67_06220 [Leuconostoc mesenteroides]|uniref:hypothetical protein n=1 Tax=Leuconostoc mesenteroides TaxID=1245 RepID=UPI001CBB02A6|nr:hypothetical protein [Leuconostoc mesenteroides]MBZ1511514.1 hypothetical protein [Leuconostoc mesenteroides]MBZ1540890.1 hypothetical protein [Leuconostoc mesenteroides]